MSDDLEARIRSVLTQAIEEIGALTDSDALGRVAARFAGKKGPLAEMRAQLATLDDVDAKRRVGKALTVATAQLEVALADRQRAIAADEMRDRIAGEQLDLTEFLTTGRRGRSHIVTQSMQRLEDVFVGLGFEVAEGPEVETDFYNFEALNMPKSHPARSEFDTMFIEPRSADQEPNSVLLRTHTSPVQIRLMQRSTPPIYAVMPGRVFRRDTPDATHMPVFHQIEGLVVDKGITFADLAGTIEAFTKAFFGSEFTSRLRPSFFPFTEPSAEFDIRRADGEWIELGGCGMVHPNVLRAGGIDPEEYTGFAFGFGIDRMAKERHGVADIREMYTNDLRFLRQFR
jgi:phenylalanyl-tRNA synthetase alpha chain